MHGKAYAETGVMMGMVVNCICFCGGYVGERVGRVCADGGGGGMQKAMRDGCARLERKGTEGNGRHGMGRDGMMWFRFGGGEGEGDCLDWVCLWWDGGKRAKAQAGRGV